MRSLLWLAVAIAGEVAGCYAFWMWVRLNRSPAVLPWGLPALLVFAFALTRIDSATAGRAYAACSAIHLLGALVWTRTVEDPAPDHRDRIGTGICLVGAAVILDAPRPV